MAINPNTNFTAGQVLTADQANRWPRGIVAEVSETANGTASTVETVTLTASTFTAVADRYYRITYYEPIAQNPGGAGNSITARIRLTNAAGTQLGQGQLQASGATQSANSLNVVTLATFSAGSVVVVGTFEVNAGASNLFRGSGAAARIIVEDIGPA